MRVLCFGLEMGYDRRAGALRARLEEEIGLTKDRLEGLDPVWLKRNVASLNDIPRPADFQEYESDDECMGDGVPEVDP